MTGVKDSTMQPLGAESDLVPAAAKKGLTWRDGMG
jgi:hypothetical protein